MCTCNFDIHEHNVSAQGQAGFATLNFELPVSLVARMDSGKPGCPACPLKRLVMLFHMFKLDLFLVFVLSIEQDRK